MVLTQFSSDLSSAGCRDYALIQTQLSGDLSIVGSKVYIVTMVLKTYPVIQAVLVQFYNLYTMVHTRHGYLMIQAMLVLVNVHVPWFSNIFMGQRSSLNYNKSKISTPLL